MTIKYSKSTNISNSKQVIGWIIAQEKSTYQHTNYSKEIPKNKLHPEHSEAPNRGLTNSNQE